MAFGTMPRSILQSRHESELLLFHGGEMKKLELLPCKKHGIMPSVRERKLDPLSALGYLNTHTITEYYCPACDLDTSTEKQNVLIEAWNKKQEER
jgi:hypothetical protein